MSSPRHGSTSFSLKTWGVLALLVLYGAALFLMVFTVAQPSLSQTLRLNED